MIRNKSEISVHFWSWIQTTAWSDILIHFRTEPYEKALHPDQVQNLHLDPGWIWNQDTWSEPKLNFYSGMFKNFVRSLYHSGVIFPSRVWCHINFYKIHNREILLLEYDDNLFLYVLEYVYASKQKAREK